MLISKESLITLSYNSITTCSKHSVFVFFNKIINTSISRFMNINWIEISRIESTCTRSFFICFYSGQRRWPGFELGGWRGQPSGLNLWPDVRPLFSLQPTPVPTGLRLLRCAQEYDQSADHQPGINYDVGEVVEREQFGQRVDGGYEER